MTVVEQHKMLLALRDFERKMSRQEQEEFQMFMKRDKDDEYLDELSQKKLQKMHDTYVKSGKPAGNMDDALKELFKKNKG